MYELNHFPNKTALKAQYESYRKQFGEVLSGVESYVKDRLKLSSVPTYKARIKNFDS